MDATTHAMERQKAMLIIGCCRGTGGRLLSVCLRAIAAGVRVCEWCSCVDTSQMSTVSGWKRMVVARGLWKDQGVASRLYMRALLYD